MLLYRWNHVMEIAVISFTAMRRYMKDLGSLIFIYYILYIIYYKRRKERFNILFIFLIYYLLKNWRSLIKDMKQNQICLHSDSTYLHYFSYSFIMEKLYKIFKVLKNVFYKIFYKRNIKNIRYFFS